MVWRDRRRHRRADRVARPRPEMDGYRVRDLRDLVDSPYRLIVEHAVPLRVLRDVIQADSALWQVERLRHFLLANYRRGVLLKEEDRRLDQAGLKQVMPKTWAPGDDPFARYRKVGLACGKASTSPRAPARL